MRLRLAGHSAWAPECEAISGASSSLGDVPEARLVEVAEVDGDPELGAAAHEPDARRRQARPGVGRARVGERHAVGERVRAAPDRAERAQAGGVQHVERAAGRGRPPRRPRCGPRRRASPASRAASRSPGPRASATWPSRSSSSSRPSVRGDERRRRELLADRRGRLAVERRVARRGGEGGEDPAAEAARAGARKVDVAALAARREVVRVVARERVVVAVEDRQHGAHAGSRPRRGDAPQAKSGPGALRGKRAGALGAGTR